MATETGSATGIADLLDKLRAFAAANGYTVNRFEDVGSLGVTYNLNLEKSGKFYNFEGDVADDSINLSLSTSYADVGFSFQENDSRSAAWVQVNAIPGPYPNYWFIKDDYCIHVVIEISTGIFRHLHFGELIKFGDYVGGEYICGLWWSQGADIDHPRDSAHAVPFSDYSNSGSGATNRRGGVVRADHSSISPNWAIFGDSGGADWARGDIMGQMNIYMLEDSPNTLNQVIALLPIGVYVNDGSNNYYTVGQVSNMRACDIENINPKEDVLSTWKIFPLTAKNGPPGQPNSATYGIAYDMSV